MLTSASEEDYDNATKSTPGLQQYSKNKPKEVNPKPEPKIKWNNKTEESYKKEGFPDRIPYQISAPSDRKREFLAEVDTRKGPVERTVTMMVRLKAPDWSTEKHTRKEYIYYMEDWEGKNWLGGPVNKVTEHEEGRHNEVQTKPVIDATNGRIIENEWNGLRQVYTIPFSKKAVDDIIAKSAHSDRESIKFVIKFGQQDSPDGVFASSRQQYGYEQFANWTWEELCVHQYRPKEKFDDFSRPKTANTLQFVPS